MNQKYFISRDSVRNSITIREYADLERNPGGSGTFLAGKYSLLSESVYDAAKLKSASEQGLDSLVQEIRTPDFYPAAFHAERIAQAVVRLLEDPQMHSLEVTSSDLDPLEAASSEVES